MTTGWPRVDVRSEVGLSASSGRIHSNLVDGGYDWLRSGYAIHIGCREGCVIVQEEVQLHVY